MNRRILEPYGWGLPLAVLIIAALGQSETAAKLLVACCGMSVCALAAPDALRQGNAELISRRKVLGSGLIALAFTLLSGAAVLAALGYRAISQADENAMLIVAATAQVGIRCLGELFAAREQPVRRTLSDVLSFTAVALPALILPFQTNALETAAAIAALSLDVLLVLLVMSLISRKRVWPQWSLRFAKYIPSALVRVMLYPALAIALVLSRAVFGQMTGKGWEIAAAAAGLLVVELSKSTFRRDESESAGLCTTLTLLSAGAAVVSACSLLVHSGDIRSAMLNLPMMIVLSAGCGLALYAPCGRRSIAAAALLMVIPFVPNLWSFMPVLKAAAVIATAALMLPEWRTLLMGFRAARIRKKAGR